MSRLNGAHRVAEAWCGVRRVLAVRLDNLGDVLVTSPAIHAIHDSLPEAEITLLASPVGAQAGRLHPDVADVIVYEAPWMDPWMKLPHDSAREQRMIATLRERRFDAVVIFTSFRQSSLPAAYLCYLADIPLRLGASIDGSGSLLTTRHKHPEHMLHEVERGLDLVGAVGMGTRDLDLALRVPDESRQRIYELLDDFGVARRAAGLHAASAPGGADSSNGGGDSSEGRPLIIVHPGCSMPARTYPWEMYVQVADWLVARLGATVVLTGTEEEQELVDRIRGQIRQPSLTLAGELTFPEFCALIEAADVTITNNTGPMHIAAAVKTPVVALFALTNPPEQWGPWRVRHRQLYHEVPCRLCYSRICPTDHACLRLVSPDMVVDATAELLTASLYREMEAVYAH